MSASSFIDRLKHRENAQSKRNRMKRIIFFLSLGSASTSEEMDIPDRFTDEDIENALIDWRNEQIEIGWQQIGEEE